MEYTLDEDTLYDRPRWTTNGQDEDNRQPNCNNEPLYENVPCEIPSFLIFKFKVLMKEKFFQYQSACTTKEFTLDADVFSKRLLQYLPYNCLSREKCWPKLITAPLDTIISKCEVTSFSDLLDLQTLVEIAKMEKWNVRVLRRPVTAVMKHQKEIPLSVNAILRCHENDSGFDEIDIEMESIHRRHPQWFVEKYWNRDIAKKRKGTGNEDRELPSVPTESAAEQDATTQYECDSGNFIGAPACQECGSNEYISDQSQLSYSVQVEGDGKGKEAKAVVTNTPEMQDVSDDEESSNHAERAGEYFQGEDETLYGDVVDAGDEEESNNHAEPAGEYFEEEDENPYADTELPPSRTQFTEADDARYSNRKLLAPGAQHRQDEMQVTTTTTVRCRNCNTPATVELKIRN